MKRLLAITVLLSILFAAPSVRAETDAITKAAEEQLEAAVKTLKKDYDITLTYEVTPRNHLTLNDVFGFIAKVRMVLSGDDGKKWTDRISSLGGLVIHFRNTENKDEFLVTEVDANATVRYNRREMPVPELLDTLCSERKSYITLSGMVKKMKLKIRMGEGVSWSRAAVFVRSLQGLVKKPKHRKALKEFTIVVEKRDENSPDYENKVVHVPVSMTGERLIERLNDHRKEYDAWRFCRKVMENLAKQSIEVRLADKFKGFVPINFWRRVKEIMSKLNRMAQNPKYRVIMASRPIIITDGPEGAKEDGYYLSLHSPDTVEEVFNR